MEFCSDIGMHVINRGPISCRWKTEFCSKNCYNIKLYHVFGHCMKPKDIKNEEDWKNLTGDKLKILLQNRKYNGRVRLCARGEAFSTEEDIYKIKDFLIKNSKLLIWIPTRGWRSDLREKIKDLSNIKNARIMASIDPSNSNKEVEGLIDDGWSTMFFGDDKKTENRFLCPKTWKKHHGACYSCNKGCFSKNRIDVHLKKH